MAENVQEVVFPPLPARNPVYQVLEYIMFNTEGNRNIICDEGGLEAFEEFIGSLREIFDTWPLVYPRGLPLKEASTLGCGA